jgi:hypothetical protein
MRMLNPTCDFESVEQLIDAATIAMEEASYDTTPAEVISATLTLLDRTLRAHRRLQPAADRFATAAAIRKVLSEMITDHGSVPS